MSSSFERALKGQVQEGLFGPKPCVSLHFSCRALLLSLLVAASLPLLSCDRRAPSGMETGELVILRADGRSCRVSVEFARTEAERSLGLMYRTKLAGGEGMLFVFEREEPLHFWMKNTLIPLSIAFIAGNGRIVDIQDMEAGSLETVSSRLPARYALEVPQGWFAKEGIDTGDTLLLQSLPSK